MYINLQLEEILVHDGLNSLLKSTMNFGKQLKKRSLKPTEESGGDAPEQNSCELEPQNENQEPQSAPEPTPENTPEPEEPQDVEASTAEEPKTQIEDEKLIVEVEQPIAPTEPKKPSKNKLFPIIIAVVAVALMAFAIPTILNLTNLSDDSGSTTQSEMVEVSQEVLDMEKKGFVLVEYGKFMMGSNDDEEDQAPAHEVAVHNFYLAKSEVTQALWYSVMGNNPSEFIGDNNPVENVSWFDCIQFCNRLSEKEGLNSCYYIGSDNKVYCESKCNGYRLPTEAEWEFAARGGRLGNGYAYSGSNSAPKVACYGANSNMHTAPVGSKAPNELGLYDMSGNVYEWCWDVYANYDASSSTIDHNSATMQRVNRGGSFRYQANYCTVTFRSNRTPTSRLNRLGFRLARNI